MIEYYPLASVVVFRFDATLSEGVNDKTTMAPATKFATFVKSVITPLA